MNSRARVLLVDERADERALAAVVLRQQLPEIEPEEVGDAVVFAERLARGEFVAIVTEVDLSWGGGLKVLETVKSLYPDRPVVFFTSPAEFLAFIERFQMVKVAGILSKDLETQERFLSFLVDLVLALRSFLPRWN